VRVVSCGAGDAASVEFCGGTHLDRTSQVGLFKILSEESVARGVRRITAVTGRAAVEHVQRLDRAARRAAAALRVPIEELPERIAALQQEVKQLRKRPAGAGAAALEAEVSLPTQWGPVLIGQVETTDPAAMRRLCDVHRRKGAAGVLLGGSDGRKVTLVAMVSKPLAASGEARADEWVRAAAAVVGGGGGGKPTLAQAGGRSPEKLPEALSAGREWIAERVGGGR
jgi:alanyl-tRNA synthetase